VTLYPFLSTALILPCRKSKALLLSGLALRALSQLMHWQRRRHLMLFAFLIDKSTLAGAGALQSKLIIDQINNQQGVKRG
jgi:hypothetical protein